METRINRLVIFVYNNGLRTRKNNREAERLEAQGVGYIESLQGEKNEMAEGEMPIANKKNKKKK